MAEIRCPNCQTELNTTAQFCRRCGFKVSAPLANPSGFPSITEATTRNLPNLPNMPDFRQTNNFTNPPFGQMPPPGAFQQQAPYVAVPQVPPRRGNGPKIILVTFVLFAVFAFGMVFALVRPFSKGNKRPPAPPSAPIPGTSFAKTFVLPANGQISLETLSGKIDVTTYDGDTVEFRASKGDGNNISIDDAIDMNLDPAGNSFSAKYRGGRNANVSYEIKVPRKVGSLNLKSVSGSIRLDGLEGNIKINSISGDVTLRDIAGSLDLQTVSGDQEITFRNSPTGDLKFKTTSGDVDLTFRTEPDLKVSGHSTTGDFKSAWPISTSSRPASTTITGVWGKGLYNLLIETVSGDVNIRK